MAIGLAMACSGAAFAQTSAAPTSAPAADAAVEEVIVVGARASQQSAINRKKRANTATDSIVADDVGSFPDRNLNEALSRIAGTALSRDEYGEGSGVSIRGNGPEQTRVELDGMGVPNTSGNLAISLGNESDGGRGSDLRELPAELIKSVDVVKGSTADMTEGSLGGSVKVTTRSGLDFKKPYFSIRLGAQQNDQGEKLTPDVTIVASRKFFDNKLGVIANFSRSEIQNNSSRAEVVTSQNAGYARIVDFDQSPNKTFVFNPAALQGTGVNTPFVNGTGANAYTSTETPLSVVTKSANATSKAECLTLFPVPAIAGNSTLVTNTKNQKALEQQTCLNQWDDYTPSLLRSFINYNEEIRTGADIRFDYQLTDNLKVYAKFAIADRLQNQQNASRGMGVPSVNNAPAPLGLPPVAEFTQCLSANVTTAQAGTCLTEGVNGTTVPQLTYINYLNAVPRTDQVWYQYNALFPNGGFRTVDTNPAAGTGANISNSLFPNYGQLVNVVPGSVLVDANHHVTQYTITNGSAGINQNSHTLDVQTAYAQFGGEYWKGPLRVEFVANMSKGSYSRDQIDVGRTYSFGRATSRVNSAGLWEWELPANYDDTNPLNFIQFSPQAAQTAANATATAPARVAYSAIERPLLSNTFSLSMSPGIQENEETAFKVDATYDLRDRTPFFTSVKTGISYRNPITRAWGRGGRVIRPRNGTDPSAVGFDPGVYVPSMTIRGNFRACQPTTTSIEPCPTGFVPNVDPSTKFWGTEYFTPERLEEILTQYTVPGTASFFDGADGTVANDSFSVLDAKGLVSIMGQGQYMNFDCMKRCMANDGQIYDLPYFLADEKITATYAMINFEHTFPFDLEFGGNIGFRHVQTDRTAGGIATFTSIRKIECTTTVVLPNCFDPNNPNLATGIITSNVTVPTTLDRSTNDFLPSVNLYLWLVPDQVVVRGYVAKTINQQSIGRLIPNGTCTIDERTEDINEGLDGDDEVDQRCTTMGNPALKPYEARNHNISVEWYPNRDTMFSLAWHKLDIQVGGPTTVTKINEKFFAGSNVIDPGTGLPVADQQFTFNTYENLTGGERKGLEFQAKTAFTFLPGFLRYTGADFNYSTLISSGLSPWRDPLTNEFQPPQNESAYYSNLSLWYDDGRLAARVTYQDRGETFISVTGATGNVVNNPPIGNPQEATVRLDYNPGEPYFRAANAYIDAKVSYKIRPDLEVYLEGRNLGKETTVTQGVPDAGRGFESGAPTVYGASYGGRRVMFGLTYRYGL